MNFVEPIRDRKKIAQIKNLLRGQRRYRDLLLFVVGINTALRISDLLQLRVVHLKGDRQHVKRRLWIREQKRGKRHEITINNRVRGVFEEFLEAYSGIAENPKHFLFFNTKIKNYAVQIKRDQAWKFITSICGDVGLRGNYGTHSLRKTWGYHARMRCVDLAGFKPAVSKAWLCGDSGVEKQTPFGNVNLQRAIQWPWR